MNPLGKPQKFKLLLMVILSLLFFIRKIADWSLLVIVENGVKLRLNIVDTPGYGDQVNNENWFVEFVCRTSIYD
jgi:hypothetical protein